MKLKPIPLQFTDAEILTAIKLVTHLTLLDEADGKAFTRVTTPNDPVRMQEVLRKLFPDVARYAHFAN